MDYLSQSINSILDSILDVMRFVDDLNKHTNLNQYLV